MNFKKGDWVCSKTKGYSISRCKDYEVLEVFAFIDEFLMIKDDTGDMIGMFSDNFELSPRNICLQRYKKLKRLNQ